MDRGQAIQMDIPRLSFTDFELAEMPVVGQGRQPLFTEASNFLVQLENKQKPSTLISSAIELKKMMGIG